MGAVHYWIGVGKRYFSFDEHDSQFEGPIASSTIYQLPRILTALLHIAW